MRQLPELCHRLVQHWNRQRAWAFTHRSPTAAQFELHSCAVEVQAMVDDTGHNLGEADVVCVLGGRAAHETETDGQPELSADDRRCRCREIWIRDLDGYLVVIAEP